MLYDTKNPHGGDIYAGNVRLDFSANTNPFGTPESVLAAITRALPEVHRYPDPYCRALCAAIAAAEGVPEEYILCGSGAAELIYAFADAVRPQRAAELAPTFAEYSLALARTGCAVARYTLSEKNDFAPDGGILNFLRETRPEVFFLCNPNNPTGRLADGALLKEILALCEKLGTYLFADECFLDLTDGGESLKPFLTRCPRLLSSRRSRKATVWRASGSATVSARTHRCCTIFPRPCRRGTSPRLRRRRASRRWGRRNFLKRPARSYARSAHGSRNSLPRSAFA